MSQIRVMKDVLANKIAAGEIIERPMSVVKELVENAIDAESKVINIKLKSSGLESIVVIDDGNGMVLDDLELCIKRHATSKLFDDRDLFSISTLGFRGEAIPSIYSVSKMQITSSIDGNTANKLIKIDDDKYKIEEASANKGTKIVVNNLFYNTPVRYKHLSNPFYELSIIVNYINKVSLINNDISFKLINDDNTLIHTFGDSNIKSIFSNQYNPTLSNNMLEINMDNEHFKLKIITSSPIDTRSRKNHITISVNKRLVRNYEIENQIIQAYDKFLHTNQFPITFIEISVNYNLIDVNIHPTKQQVKISLLDELLIIINKEIKQSLSNVSYISKPQINDKVYKNNNSFSINNLSVFEKNNNKKNYSDSLFDSVQSVDDQNLTQVITKNNSLINNHIEELDFLSSLHNTYLLFQSQNGLYLVDQHAAQERIKYEQYYEKYKNKTFIYQQLLLPIIIELTTQEQLLFTKKHQELECFGIKVESFGINTYKVLEIDSWMSNRDNIEDDIIDLIHLIIENKKHDFASFYEEVAIMMACKKSIKANHFLDKLEADDLIKQLRKCNQPFTCPHGRPIFVNITIKEIEKMFKRTF